MKKIIILLSSITILAGCSTVPKVTNRQELNAHANAMLHYGVKDKDSCKLWYDNMASTVAADATKPINTDAIDKYYKKLADEDPYTDIRQMYNQGIIDWEKYQLLKAQRREELLARLQLFLSVNQAMNQSMQSANASIQSMNQSQQAMNAHVLSAFQNQSASSIGSPNIGSTTPQGNYLGQWSANQYDPNSISNPFGAGNQYRPDGINNPYSQYNNPYSSKSINNPYATDTPKLYDADGNYRGKISNNPYDPESISNPYGRYGNPYSPDSIKNPYGAGNPYSPSSPSNPYGQGMSIYGE